MNIIKTVGDLRRALSPYPEDWPLFIEVDGQQVVFNNDTCIMAHGFKKVVISVSVAELKPIESDAMAYHRANYAAALRQQMQRPQTVEGWFA